MGIFRWMIGAYILLLVVVVMSAEGVDVGVDVGVGVDVDVDVEKEAEFFLGCMRLAKGRGRHYEALAPSERWQVEFCGDILRFHMYAYEATGVLATGYKEALLMRYRYNQTLVDFEICGLDPSRCPDHVLQRSSDYVSQLIDSHPIVPEPDF